MQKQLSALGVQTVYTQTYPADTTNFQSIASQLAAKKPDLIAQANAQRFEPFSGAPRTEFPERVEAAEPLPA